MVAAQTRAVGRSAGGALMTCRRFLVMILTVSGAAVSTSRLLAVPPYSPWSPAVNLGSPINSSFTETGVTLSKNGLSLYFSSNRPCDQTDAVADFNLWVVHRNSREMPWGEPECLRINARRSDSRRLSLSG